MASAVCASGVCSCPSGQWNNGGTCRQCEFISTMVEQEDGGGGGRVQATRRGSTPMIINLVKFCVFYAQKIEQSTYIYFSTCVICAFHTYIGISANLSLKQRTAPELAISALVICSYPSARIKATHLSTIQRWSTVRAARTTRTAPAPTPSSPAAAAPATATTTPSTAVSQQWPVRSA